MRKALDKFKTFWAWAIERPTVIINLIGLSVIVIGGFCIFFYYATVPINVLTDWKVQTTRYAKGEELPRYNPGGTLEYISSSNKLISARGEVVRTFKCEGIPGIAGPRDIRLPASPASRAPGISAPSEISIVVPSIVEFNGLPRTCFLRLEVCYTDVILWRDKCEQADSNKFIVEIAKTDSAELEKHIKDLQAQLDELIRLRAEETGTSNSSTAAPRQNTTNNSTTNNTTNNTIIEEQPTPEQKGLIEQATDGVTNLVDGAIGGIRSLFGR